MNKSKIVSFVKTLGGPAAIGLAFPLASFAYVCPSTMVQGTIEYVLCRILLVINGYVVPLLIAIGVLWFIWGVISFITAKDEEKKTEARSTMIHGIIALFVIVAVWGLVRLVQNFFGVTSGGFESNYGTNNYPGL